jgi:diguanylate cyclase (GGDEF)-like protein
MSFPRRLTATVVLIVLVPVLAIVIILVPLSSESRTGKADARLAGALTPALNDYRAGLREARRAAGRVASDQQFASALSGGSAAALKAPVRELASTEGLIRLDVIRHGTLLASVSRGRSVASVKLRVRDLRGRKAALVASTTDAGDFVARVGEVTGLPFVISVDDERVATGGAGASGLDLSGQGSRTEDVNLPSGDYRARIFSLPNGGREIRAALLGPRESGFSGDQTLVVVILVALVLLAFALIGPLVSDLRRQHERTAEEAITDELTGLSNHRRFRQILAKEVERAKRFDRPLSVMMLDLDDFKEINDTFGHLQGDRVLREVGQILRSESREVDEPARYGGEEFAIALPETGSDGAVEVGERIRKRLEGMHIALEGRRGEITIRASVGVAGTPEQPLSVQTLLEAADQALYNAKRSGKNRTVRAEPGRARQPVAG